jgi:DnaK suppressor protein
VKPAAAARHRALLLSLRQQLLATGPTPIQPNRADPATSGVADEDAQALSEMMQVLASKRNEGQAAQLARLDGALRRLAAQPDDFDLCQDCEEAIPPKRLQLMPWATRCAACQGRHDPKLGAPRRKLTDYR